MDPNTIQPAIEPTFEERIAPYVEMITYLKAEIAKGGNEPVGFLSFDMKEDASLIAVMALMEEYELLERCFKEVELLKQHSPTVPSVFELLNAHVSSQLSSWEPTPLYYITGKKQRESMKDVPKMLNFLYQFGAIPIIPAGDGSTPLWNQTHAECPVELLKTLLDIGADPNQISVNEESEYLPLTYCLLPSVDDDNNILPYELEALEKAKLLLEYGADPNLASPCLPDFPPLMMLIRHGQPNYDSPYATPFQELIQLLLDKGANPNFVDSEGNTPLSLASENELLQIAHMLLLCGAKMPEKTDDTDEVCPTSTPTEIPNRKYKTTFNYLLTHCVIPHNIFSDYDAFHSQVLPYPDTLQTFLQKLVTHAASIAEGNPNFEPAYPIEKFEMSILDGKIQNQSVIVVEFPVYAEDCDSVAFAIPTQRENSGYFTCEIGTNIITNENCLILGEWKPDGNGGFKHLNHGEVTPTSLRGFADKTIEIAYGEGASNTDTNQEANPSSNNPAPEASRALSSNENAQKAFEIGTKLMYDEKFDAALPHLQEAIKHDPRFSQAYDHISIVYRRLGNLEEAEKAGLQSLTIDDKNIVAYNNLAIIYRQMERVEDVAKMYGKVYEIDPENPESYFGMGTLLLQLGDHEKSKELLFTAIEKYEKKQSNLIYNAFYNQGINHFELKEYDRALYCFEQALKAYPNDDFLKKRIAEIEGMDSMKNVHRYPPAVDPRSVGKYKMEARSGGGFFYDEVLEYRVWVNPKFGYQYYKAFATYEEAMEFSEKTQGSEVPLALVYQREHINEPQPGVYEHVVGDRVTEWRVEWLTENTKRNENSIKSFLQQYKK